MKFTKIQLPDGRVRIRWRERQPDGRYLRPQETLPNRKAADERIAELTLAARDGRLDARTVKLRSLNEIALEWAAVRAATLAPGTLNSYVADYDRHIEPYLGSLAIGEFERPTPLEEWNATLATRRLDSNGRWIEKPVGEATRRRCLMIVSSILSFAERRGYIDRHAVRLMDKSDKPKAGRQRAIEAWSVERVERLRMWMLKDSPVRGLPNERDRLKHAAMISMLAYTGMRPCELRALTMRDVRERTVTVSKLISDQDVEHRLKARSINKPRHPQIIQPLRDDIDAWLDVYEADPDAALFPDTRGLHWNQNVWNEWRIRLFKPAMEAAKVTGDVRPYALRHTCVSLRIMQGDSIVEIAEDLGHSPTMTLNTYAHVIGEYRGLAPERRASIEAMVVAARAKVLAERDGQKVDAEVDAEHTSSDSDDDPDIENPRLSGGFLQSR